MNKEFIISYFKSHCLEIIDKLQINGEQIIVTKRDKPVAKIIPIEKFRESLFGMFKNKAEIKKDIIEPTEEVWDINNW